jgi:serine/threonine protein kinase
MKEISGQSDAVVQVLGHGWLPKSAGWYFIDMEYCTETLEQRISDMASGVGTSLVRPNPSESPQTMVSPVIDKDPPHSTIIQRRDSAPNEPVDEEQMFFDSMFFDWELVMKILQDVTSGLAYLHSKGIVHRDVKPSNGSKP